MRFYLILFVIFAGGLWVYEAYSPPAQFQPKPSLNVSAIEREGQRAVKHHLKDADSAQFRDLFIREHEEMVILCGWVNAKNSLGGYTGYHRFVTGGVNATWLEGHPDFFLYWDATCL
tara:strand:- start:323 stop:673 length:351 start_codon:yes stop_codon:yes gene_type:complete